MHASRQNQTERLLPRGELSQLPYHYIKYVLAAVLLVFIVLDMANDPTSNADIETVAGQGYHCRSDEVLAGMPAMASLGPDGSRLPPSLPL